MLGYERVHRSHKSVVSVTCLLNKLGTPGRRFVERGGGDPLRLARLVGICHVLIPGGPSSS